MSSSNQTPLCFIDTNVWLYAFIPSQDPTKFAKAKLIIQQSEIIISPQVINEICVNLIKKAQFDEAGIRQIDKRVLRQVQGCRHRSKNFVESIGIPRTKSVFILGQLNRIERLIGRRRDAIHRRYE